MARKPSAFRWTLASLVLLLGAVSLAAAGPAPKDVVLHTADGVEIKATYYPPQRPGSRPSVILLHMLNRTRADWTAFARALVQGGLRHRGSRPSWPRRQHARRGLLAGLQP